MKKRNKKFLWIGVFCMLVLAVLAVGVVAQRFHEEHGRLTLSLNGDHRIYLEYGQNYQEPGVQSQLIRGDKVTDLPVETQGQVDATRLGNYLIKYIVTADTLVRTDYRSVYVIDTAAPVIKLTASPDAYTLPNTPYQEEGFVATDNYDGDITQRVVRTESDGAVTYTVSDSSGNTTSVTRTIRYYDPALPELQLQGSLTSFITMGELYEDPGFSATDKYDGDLTSAVTVTGSVDPNVTGVYTMHYSVTNRYGNTASANRIVYVIPPEEDKTNQPQPPAEPDDSLQKPIPTGGTAIEPNGKVIYLTFDDGPGRNTEKLLDTLAKYGVKATFFVVNNSYIDMIARTAQEGHTVAIHTYTHKYSQIYASDDAFLADLQAMQAVIEKYTGQQTMLTRFPGGSSNSISSAYNRGIMTRLTKKLQQMGYQYFDWNVDSNDAGGAKTSEEVFNNVVKGVESRQNSVVLQHDTQDFSVDAVEKIIVWGLCNGYAFAPLTYESPTCHHGVYN